MNAEIFVEWLRRQGHRIIRTPSSYWCDQGPRVYQAVPHHWCIQPSEQELRQLLREEQAIALRYSTAIEATRGKASYHVVLEGAGYGLKLLSANARSTVQRGLKRCRVAPIPLSRLAEEGWRLQRDTQERQGRVGSLDQKRWERLCVAAQDLPGFEAWGAIVHDDLTATILTACVDGVCYMLYPQSHRDYFASYVNNALAYTVTHEMLSRPGVERIFYGLHSLDAPGSVDEFKFRSACFFIHGCGRWSTEPPMPRCGACASCGPPAPPWRRWRACVASISTGGAPSTSKPGQNV
jgi:hypothetical protein